MKQQRTVELPPRHSWHSPGWTLRGVTVFAALTVAGVAALVTGLSCGLSGCANDPFDPATIPNQAPVARIFVGPGESDTLNATSYYQRTFHWSGSDADGFVVRYFVSIETVRGVAAPWDTTTSTDTTMTFVTDDNGHAEATIRVVCKDDRGALSDTVSQYIPLRNFPPAVNFQADYDTVGWSYSSASFRFFALDLDGNETLNDSILYKLDTADTNLVFSDGEPGADPSLGWVKKPFDDISARTFSIELRNIPPSPQRTLTISVTDEARADTRFHWDWEVRPAVGPALVMTDAGPFTDEFYFPLLDNFFGAGQWSRYEINTVGVPDQLWVLTETFRQFEVVIWYTGGSPSQNLGASTAALREYLVPTAPGAVPGKLLLLSQKIVGSSTNLPTQFIQQVLGLSPTAAPANYFFIPAGNQALGLQPHLPAITSTAAVTGGTGVQLLAGTEALYQMEYCRTCYGNRPPFDPFVGYRRPERSVAPSANVVGLTVQLEYCAVAEASAALQALLAEELGVVSP